MGPTPYQYLPLWAKVAIERLDADGDGRLKRGEVPARLHRLFDKLDANADGVVDEQELAAGLPLLLRRGAE